MTPTPPFIIEAVSKVLKAIEGGQSKVQVTTPIGQIAMVSKILYEYLPPSRVYHSKVLIVTDRRQIAEDVVRSLLVTYKDESVASYLKDGSGEIPLLATTAHAFLSTESNGRLKNAALSFHLVIFMGCERMSTVSTQNPMREIAALFRRSIQIGIDNDYRNSIELLGYPVFIYSIKKAIEDQVFVPYKVTILHTSLNLANNPSNEFLDEDGSMKTGRFLTFKDIDLSLVDKIIQATNNEKTVIYCSSQDVARKISDAMNNLVANKRFSTAVISSKGQNEVFNAIQQFAFEDYPVVLTAVDMLTTREDLPNIKHLVILRNIYSTPLLNQILSTGLLPYPGKEFLNVIDCTDTFKFIQPIDVEYPIEREGAAPEVLLSNAGQNGDESNWTMSRTKFLFRDKSSIEGVLGVKDTAEELAEVINTLPSERGSMIGIFGKWGRGKTFLMEHIWQKLRQVNGFERIDYHAWKYQDTPASWAYLYEILSQKYYSPYEKQYINKVVGFLRCIRLNIKRKGILTVFSFFIMALWGVVFWLLGEYFSTFKSNVLKTGITILGVSIYSLAVYKLFGYLKKEYSAEAKDLFLKYSKKHSFKEHLGIQAEIQKEIVDLLKTWIPRKKIGKKKLVLFVDDIDRCSENKIIQLIDSLRVMLEDDHVAKRMVVITAVDERILKYAIKWKYHDLSSYSDGLDMNLLTREYIDKLFIIGIKLGDLSIQEREEFFMELVKNDYIYNHTTAQTSDIETDARVEIELKDIEKNELGTLGDNIYFESDNIDRAYISEKPGLSPATAERTDKLLAEEAMLIRSCLKDYVNATPRQIRILYYRYLIAKNLLIKQYSKLMRPNIWATSKYSKIFITLLMSYSQQEDPTLLGTHKAAVLESEATEMNAFLLEVTVLPRADYSELLKVFDIVIAY